jgi:endonuclease/exonuclease/phosphatase family metal-dependent hydrolase
MSSNTLSVCTFNILSPCYKRLSSEYDRESAYESLWQTRHLSIIKLLQSLEINLICLQEFWFQNPLFAQLYQSNLSSKYSFYTLRRTGFLDDGLAILVDRNHVKVIDKCDFKLNDIGHRVGLLLHIEFHGKSLLLLNVHLTFPHYRFERRVRLKQMKKFLDLINEYRLSKNVDNQSSIILCGDFNSSYHNDSVYQLIEKQFQSSYRVIHGYEPNVTHLTHRNEQLGVDFIFYKSNILKPISSELIPKGCNHLIWNDQTGWKLSDHRPVITTFKYNENQ